MLSNWISLAILLLVYLTRDFHQQRWLSKIFIYAFILFPLLRVVKTCYSVERGVHGSRRYCHPEETAIIVFVPMELFILKDSLFRSCLCLCLVTGATAR